MTLKFKDWDSLNEASIVDRIKNWLSGTFGGKIDSLDKLAEEYRRAELEYVDKWEDINVELDKLELERSQTKSDPAEVKRIDRLIQRNKELMNAQAKAHEKRTESIFSKVIDAIGENTRVRLYWEKHKTKVDADIAQEMYSKAKNLADSSLSGALYSKYKNAVLRAKQKDEDFKRRYGNLMTKSIERGDGFDFGSSQTKRPSSKMDSYSDSPGASTSEASFEFLSKLPLSEFSLKAKDLPSAQAKKLVSFLVKERNDRYVAMDMERDALNKEIEAAPDKEEIRKYAAEKIKEIREKYMDEIRDLRSKITVAKRYA